MRCKSQLSGRHTSQARERSSGQAFHVQSGKGQAWDCGKSNSDDFLEPVRQLVPILVRLQEAGPGPVQGKAKKRTHPRTLWGVGLPETKHINYLAALGPAELPSVPSWARDPGSPAPLEWEQRSHIWVSRFWAVQVAESDSVGAGWGEQVARLASVLSLAVTLL